MSTLLVLPARGGLLGSVPVPSDAALAELALALAAIAAGRSEIHVSFLPERVQELARALTALGVPVTCTPQAFTVDGVDPRTLAAPAVELAFEHSALGLALTAALAGAQGLPATLSWRGYAGLLPALANVLRERGVEPRLVDEQHLSLERHSGPLAAGDTWLAAPDMLLKAALLVAGLHAAGPTGIGEAVISPDHMERLLRTLGVSVEGMGSMLRLQPIPAGAALPAFQFDVPGDLSLGAYVLAAAALVPDSRVSVRAVGLNPTRSGFLDIMRAMGVPVVATPQGEQLGEPLGEVSAFHAPLNALGLEGELLVRARAELPVVCALMANAKGASEITELEAADLPLADGLAAVCRAFGVNARRSERVLSIEGKAGAVLDAADVDCGGEAELGLFAALLGLRAQAPSRVHGAGCIAGRFPRFAGTLRALGAEIGVAA